MFNEGSSQNAYFELITDPLKDELDNLLRTQPIKNWKLIFAFITLSGAKTLIDWKQSFLKNDSKIEIITGTYLDFTNPDALQLLLDEPGIDIYIVDKNKGNLHAKCMIFEINDNDGIIILGSSNLTKNALESNIEWNGRLSSFSNRIEFNKIQMEFTNLLSLSIPISTSWIDNYRSFYKYSNEFQREREEITSDNTVHQPRYAQNEALIELENIRNLGESKALIVLATGLGKTHLAAFDSLKYQKVLFLAHQKEILEQSKKTFEIVRSFGRPDLFSNGWYTKDIADVLFATVQKMSRQKTLEKFSPEEFDYIVIDEFHHAQAKSYLKIIEYFEPQFLLGLTATPFRMDRKDVSELCDKNVPYICNMPEAIERDWLAPFNYHGIYDDTIDYTEIPWKRNGGYDQTALTVEYNRSERAKTILENYHKYPAEPTVGFCVGIEHANFMTEFFNQNGVPSVSVHSDQLRGGLSPGLAKEKINTGQAKVIFAVDVFNEGIDLPNIKKVMFLRPTQSLTVFLQQLGRGLRKFEGKDKLIVLDYIGNYKNSFIVPVLLTGSYYPHLGSEIYKKLLEELKKRKEDPSFKMSFNFPENCVIDFDLKLIEDMISRIKSINPIREGYIDFYYQVKNQLEESPTLDVMKSQSINPYNYIRSFGSWWDFKKEIGELSEVEQGYSQDEINMLRWIERVHFETELSFKIVESVFLTNELEIHLDDLIDQISNWNSANNNLQNLINTEFENNNNETNKDLRALIEQVISEKPKIRSRKIPNSLQIHSEAILKNPSLDWDNLEDPIIDRLKLRSTEFEENLHLYQIYTRKHLKRIFRNRGSADNLNYLFGSWATGITILESIRTVLFFVKLEKDPSKIEEDKLYQDKFISKTKFQWESQASNTVDSKIGKILTNNGPYFEKLLFVRLREKDGIFGSAFFYLGKVTLDSHTGEEPIQIIWNLESDVPNYYYDYFVNEKYRVVESHIKDEGDLAP